MATVKRSRYGRLESGRYTPYGAMAGVSLELKSAYYYYGWVHDADIPELPHPKWDTDTQALPDEVLAEQQTLVELGAILDSLKPRQAKILRLRFGFNCHEHTLEEIATIFEVTRERIRQIEQKALRNLRKLGCQKKIAVLLGRM